MANVDGHVADARVGVHLAEVHPPGVDMASSAPEQQQDAIGQQFVELGWRGGKGGLCPQQDVADLDIGKGLWDGGMLGGVAGDADAREAQASGLCRQDQALRNITPGGTRSHVLLAGAIKLGSSHI